MKKKKIWLLLVLILLLMVGGIAFHGYREKYKKLETFEYETYQIEKPEDLIFKGKVKEASQQMVTVNSDYGTLKTIHVLDGNIVNAGDVLLTYSGRGNWNAVQKKKKQIEQYKTTMEKLDEEKCAVSHEQEKLNTEKIQIKKKIEHYSEYESKESLSDLKLKLAKIEEKIKIKEDELINIENVISENKKAVKDVESSISTLNSTKSTVVTADFSGMVKINDAGKTDSSVPLITIYSNTHIVKVSATEYDVEKISKGQKVNISFMNQNKVIKGKIWDVSLVPEEESGAISSYQITIRTDEEIPLGYSVQVLLPQETVYIPKEALVMEGNHNYVYRYVNGKETKTEVVSEVLNEKIRIIDGLQIGDTVIVNPEGLQEQMEVAAS